MHTMCASRSGFPGLQNVKSRLKKGGKRHIISKKLALPALCAKIVFGINTFCVYCRT